MGRIKTVDWAGRPAGDRVVWRIARRGRRRVMALAVALGVCCAAFAWAPTTLLAAQPPEAAQDGFVPMDEIPADEQLPAAPLLVAAYAAVWAITIGYLWTIWRRLGTVERELADITRRVADRGQS